MDPHPHLLLLFHLLFFTALRRLSTASPSDDIRSLLEFKKGIHTDPFRVVDSWKPPTAGSAACPRDWRGISCDDSGAVVSLALDGLGLAGDLKFTTLTGLKSLRNLTLSGNAFTGRLVPTVGTMASLQHLDLSGNQFYGPVPRRITELSRLTHLNLSRNHFTQGFPTGIWKLQQLRVLDLRSNNFWGDVAVLLSELWNAEYIDLSNNAFYGPIRMDSGNLSSLGNTLRYLNLSNNKLNGGFFSSNSLRVFKSLEVLDLGYNQLNGELPTFDSLYNLKIFRAASNQLYGYIPEALFGSTMQLMELDLSGNGFTGYIKAINSTTLKLLNLSSNALSGSLPPNLGMCVSVDMSKNMLSGDLSVIQYWGDSLEAIDLSSNALSGQYPNEASQFANLISIKIQNNSLLGSLPSVLGTYPKLSFVDLSLNKFTGPILPSLFRSLTLTSLNLSGNHFTGTVPLQSPRSTESLVLPSYTHLESLDLSNNLLSTSLPPEIGNMQRLKLLDLGNNTLSGELPSELSKLGGLEFLDLSFNNFKGRIPDMLQPGLKVLNVSYNNLSGTVPQNLQRFPSTSFHPGNALLVFSDALPAGDNNTGFSGSRSHRLKSSIRVAFIVGSIGAVMLVLFAVMMLYIARTQEICGRGRTTGRDLKLGTFGPLNTFKFPKDGAVPTSMSFSNDHLLTAAVRSMSAQKELLTEAVEYGYSDSKGVSECTKLDVLEDCPPLSGWKSSLGSPFSSSPHVIDSHISEQAVKLDVYSPDRLAGELFLLDNSLMFTAEELSRAPAEVLGRGSHGTSYKATIDSGHMLTVKWLRVGLVKHKKEFAREAKRIGTIKHPNIISWRGYYWGPREQERLIVADYVDGDNLAHYLYESTPRRYSRLSVRQRLQVAIDVAGCLFYLHHEKALPHGNLKPTNILLTGPDLTARLTDFGLHRLMTQSGIAEQMLNLGALGYCAPELATTSKPCPSFKADIYAFGVILMELLTRRSAGDIISGLSGAVDLTDWVQMCNKEGRGTDCFDKDIAGLEEAPTVMDELLTVSLRCVLPVNERPNIRTVFEDLCSITV
ncbi:probable inactive receptor kinase At5g10020 [Elaeis guineensis]|uniref:Probable inactive receptor kinase At5g10020 n=1 Tax=Elaeis guineensis var. tenera TaxID=51953 RepID=A0A6I9RHJ1_ELAGV|nr:probable inactive receptor kinase At5g10020 [Elaeis guineensis]